MKDINSNNKRHASDASDELFCVNCDRLCLAYWQPFPSRSDEEEWRFASDCCSAPVTDAAGDAIDEPRHPPQSLDFFDCDEVGLE